MTLLVSACEIDTYATTACEFEDTRQNCSHSFAERHEGVTVQLGPHDRVHPQISDLQPRVRRRTNDNTNGAFRNPSELREHARDGHRLLRSHNFHYRKRGFPKTRFGTKSSEGSSNKSTCVVGVQVVTDGVERYI